MKDKKEYKEQALKLMSNNTFTIGLNLKTIDFTKGAENYRDKAVPIVADLLERVDELEKVIDDYNGIDLLQELSALKKENEGLKINEDNHTAKMYRDLFGEFRDKYRKMKERYKALKQSQGKVLSVEEIVRVIGRYSYKAVFGLPCVDATKFIELAESIHKAQKGEL